MAAVRSLDHVTIVTEHVDETAAFFEDVLGLVNRPERRPDFGFGGAWLFVGDQAVVHLIHSEEDRGTPAGAFDHAAFSTDDFDGLVARIEELGLEHRVSAQPQTGLRQVFFREPNGVEIEITSPA
ncbi:MAG: dioxygenase [Acidimicrobiales bacterium]|nr:dioxygenase [Acidimicrobiales bacterium]